jgi:hypothetical protein
MLLHVAVMLNGLEPTMCADLCAGHSNAATNIHVQGLMDSNHLHWLADTCARYLVPSTRYLVPSTGACQPGLTPEPSKAVCCCCWLVQLLRYEGLVAPERGTETQPAVLTPPSSPRGQGLGRPAWHFQHKWRAATCPQGCVVSQPPHEGVSLAPARALAVKMAPLSCNLSASERAWPGRGF